MPVYSYAVFLFVTKPLLFFIFQILASFSISFFFFLANAHDISTLNSLAENQLIYEPQETKIEEIKQVKKQFMINLTGTLSFSHTHYLNNAEQISLSRPSFKFQQNYIAPNLLDIYKPKVSFVQSQEKNISLEGDIHDVIKTIKETFGNPKSKALEAAANSANAEEKRIRNLANLLEGRYKTKLPSEEIEIFIRDNRIQNLSEEKDAKKFYNFVMNNPNAVIDLRLRKLAFKLENLHKFQNELKLDVFERFFNEAKGLNELNKRYYFKKTLLEATQLYRKYAIPDLSGIAYSDETIIKLVREYADDSFTSYIRDNPTTFTVSEYQPYINDNQELLKFEKEVLNHAYSCVFNKGSQFKDNPEAIYAISPERLLKSPYLLAIKPVGMSPSQSFEYNEKFKGMVTHILKYHAENYTKELPFLDEHTLCNNEVLLKRLHEYRLPLNAINMTKLEEHRITNEEELDFLMDTNNLAFYNMFEPSRLAASKPVNKLVVHNILLEFSNDEQALIGDIVKELKPKLLRNSEGQLIKGDKYIFVRALENIYTEIKKENKVSLPRVREGFFPYLSPCKREHIKNEYLRALIMNYLTNNKEIKSNYSVWYYRNSSIC